MLLCSTIAISVTYITAGDLFVVPTLVSFALRFIMGHGRRQILRTMRLETSFPDLIRDRDRAYGEVFIQGLRPIAKVVARPPTEHPRSSSPDFGSNRQPNPVARCITSA
jgi:hypothetical protein